MNVFEKIRPYLPILMLTAGHGAVDSYIGLLPVLAPGLAEYLNIPLGDIVMLIGISSLITNLVQPAAGWAMGHKNLAWTLWVTILVSSISCFMGFAINFPTLAAIIIVAAAATGLYHPEAVLSAHDATGEKAYLGIPMFMAGGAAIYALFTPISIKITETYGFKSLVWLILPGALLSLVFFLYHQNRKRSHPSIVIRPRSKRMTQVQAGRLSFWPLLGIAFFLMLTNGLFMAVLSSHFELQFGPTSRYWVGYTYMAFGVLGSLSSFWWSGMSRKHNYYKLVLISQILAVPLFVTIALAGSPQVAFAVALPLSVVAPVAVIPGAITLSRNASGSTQGMRTALMMGGPYAISSALVMVAGALLRSGFESRWIMLFISCSSAVAMLLALWQFLKTRKHYKPEA